MVTVLFFSELDAADGHSVVKEFVFVSPILSPFSMVPVSLHWNAQLSESPTERALQESLFRCLCSRLVMAFMSIDTSARPTPPGSVPIVIGRPVGRFAADMVGGPVVSLETVGVLPLVGELVTTGFGVGRGVGAGVTGVSTGAEVGVAGGGVEPGVTGEVVGEGVTGEGVVGEGVGGGVGALEGAPGGTVGGGVGEGVGGGVGEGVGRGVGEVVGDTPPPGGVGGGVPPPGGVVGRGVVCVGSVVVVGAVVVGALVGPGDVEGGWVSQMVGD